MSWSNASDDPIVLDDRKQLVTLRDAALFIQRLPKSEQQKLHWQLAVETLINTAEGHDLMFHANIAFRKALYHDKPAPPTTPRRKPAKKFNILR